MKVIQIMDSLGIAGGVESFVYDLCSALCDRSCDVSLIGILDSENHSEIEALRDKGIKVICLGAKSKKDAILHYVGILRNRIIELSCGEPTICNLHLKLSVLLGTLSTHGLKNIRCVETYHSQYSHYWLENKVLSPFITMYVPCSETAKAEMIQRFHIRDAKLTTIPNGINREQLRATATRTNTNMIEFVSVGRFTEQKNLHITAEAFSKLTDERFLYKIYGDGELKKKNVAAAANSPRIKFCGIVERKQILNQLANAAIVVMPSLFEGLSIFMLEAMAFDCPMMISDIPALRDVFDEPELDKSDHYRICSWGYLVKTSDTQAYRDAAKHFMTHPELWKEMRDTVRRVSEGYSIQKSAERYMNVYEGIFSNLLVNLSQGRESKKT